MNPWPELNTMMLQAQLVLQSLNLSVNDMMYFQHSLHASDPFISRRALSESTLFSPLAAPPCTLMPQAPKGSYSPWMAGYASLRNLLILLSALAE